MEVRLRGLSTQLRAGLTFGNRSRDANFLKGLPLVRKNDIGPFSMSIDELPAFSHDRAEQPRRLSTFSEPLLLVTEFCGKCQAPGQ